MAFLSAFLWPAGARGHATSHPCVTQNSPRRRCVGDTAVAQRMPRETWGQRCSARRRAQTDMWDTNGARDLHRAIWHPYNGGKAFGHLRLGGLVCAPVARRMARIETPIAIVITSPISETFSGSRFFQRLRLQLWTFTVGTNVPCGLGLRDFTGTIGNQKVLASQTWTSRILTSQILVSETWRSKVSLLSTLRFGNFELEPKGVGTQRPTLKTISLGTGCTEGIEIATALS